MKYRVFLHSRPSPAWEFYRGYVDVEVEEESDAASAAIAKLAAGAYKERGHNAWVVESVERKG